MTGKNHLLANTCTLGLLYGGQKALQSNITEYPILQPWEPMVQKFISTMTQFHSVPLYLVYGIGLVLFYLGTLLPDIDSPNAMIVKILHVSLPVEHRTWTHTMWVVLALGVLSYFVPICWWLTLGYFLHLFWDSCSRGGICWWYPLRKYRHYGSGGAKIANGHSLWLYRVGSASEAVLLTVLVMATLGLFFWEFSVDILPMPKIF